MTIIDPMHNLYLGSAKHILKDVWIGQGYISNSSMTRIQSCVDSICTPHYVGRIPHKVASSFSGFTADQFKNWTNYFSLMVLYDILPTEHIQCWRYFVQASSILCQMTITNAQIELADVFLLQFCCRVENLYGKKITPNMHLHCHLKQSVYDYGPIHNFFSYERYNGILENFPSNKRSLEIHLMKRFIQECALYSSCYYLPAEFEPDFGALFANNIEPILQGSLQVTIHGKCVKRFDPRNVNDWTLAALSDVESISFTKSYLRSSLSSSELTQLRRIYSSLYPYLILEDNSLNSVCKKYFSLHYNGLRYREKSIMYATNCSSVTQKGLATTPETVDLKPRPVMLRHFIIQYLNTVYMHLFAVVSWLKEHHARDKCINCKPFELWWKDLFDGSLDNIIPIQLLVCDAVHCDIKYEEQTVCLLCPIQNIPPL